MMNCSAMGSLGDDSGEFKPSEEHPDADFADAETQPFDSQASPFHFPGDKTDDRIADELQFTAPFYDDYLVEDAMETQVVDFAEETQVLNFGSETQVLNFCGETQVMDDLDYMENMGMSTQLMDEFDDEVALDSDDEGTNTTEVVSDSDELPDDEPARREFSTSSDKEIKGAYLCEHDKKDSMNQSDALTSEQRSSGLPGSIAAPEVEAIPKPKSGFFPRFTSLRAASLRASGLAARNSALKRADSSSSSLLTGSRVSNQINADHDAPDAEVKEDTVQLCELEKNDAWKVSSVRSNDKFGCSAARKLFNEGSLADNNKLSSTSENSDGGDDLDPLCMLDDAGAGLSYLDSQEPGELSQANALNFVEKLISDNLKELDIETDLGTGAMGKSIPVVSAKGPKDLAQKTNERIMFGETRIFDWDDTREDERGGEIFCRRKDDFYCGGSHARKSYTEPHKPKGKKLGEYRGKRDKTCAVDKLMARSGTKVTLDRTKEKGKTGEEAEINFKRNLVNEFDQQSNEDSSRKQSDPTVVETDVQKVQDVGFDTQMAAEAMEALCNVEVITNDVDYRGVQNELKGLPKASAGGKSRKRVLTRKPTEGGEVGQSDSDLGSRQLKKKKKLGTDLGEEPSVLLQTRSNNVRNNGDTEVLMPKTKRTRSTSEKDHPANGKISKDMGSTGVRTRNARRSGHFMGVDLKRAEKTPSDCTEVSNHPAESGSLQEKRTSDIPKQKRSRRNLSVKIDACNVSDPLSKQAVELEEKGESDAGLKKFKSNTRSTCFDDWTMRRATRSAVRNSAGERSEKSNNKPGFVVKEVNHSDRSDAVSPAREKADFTTHKSPKGTPKPSVCISPVNAVTPINAASPVCMGDEYFKQSCKKNLLRASLLKEIRSLNSSEPEPISPFKDTRKRKDLSNIRVMFSHHLDDEIIKQQRKILARVGIPEVSTIVDATHFVTDTFVRTRNMLQAIASGKPVITHLWLESIGQVNIYIDEETYLLRDIKKEKEFGFCMPVTLARARKHPLLEGKRVFITPNTKPGKETISNLVKDVHGQAIERIGRSVLNDDKVPADLLVLSCEEDYSICVPLLEKGATVYSSELLLNGIVTQKLDYERHRLFAEHVKRTRSTIWVRDNDKFLPVKRQK